MFSDFVLPSLSLSLDSESTSLLPTGLWSKITHPQQGNRQERKEGEKMGWGVEEETVFSHLNQFRIHSITSYCDSHFGVFGRCKGCELETAGGSGQHFAVGCFSQSVQPHYPSTMWQTDSSKGPRRTAIQLPFFSFCDCNKSTLRKAILNFVCFYFMVITIVIILLFLLMFFFFLSADDYLNAKKPIWWKWKKKRKKTWIFGIWIDVVRAATSSGHKQTHLCYTTTIPVICSLLHSHTKVGGGYRTDLPLPALCLMSQILLGETSFDLILGDSFSWKRNLYNSCKAFWEG